MTDSSSQTDDRAMAGDIVIRPERSGDEPAIHDLTRRAFAPMPYSDGDEHYLLDALRAAGVLTLSLVAERDGAIVGHVAFTPAFPEDGSSGWYTLGPVAAEPDLQRRGIGSRLIETGLGQLRDGDAAGCVLVGDPAYYGRFGFERSPDHTHPGDHADYFQILAFDRPVPDCVIDHHPLFSETHAPENAAGQGEP